MADATAMEIQPTRTKDGSAKTAPRQARSCRSNVLKSISYARIVEGQSVVRLRLPQGRAARAWAWAWAWTGLDMGGAGGKL